MIEGLTIDQRYGTFLNVTNNLAELYVPLTTRQEEVVSCCNSDAWKKFVKWRKDYARNSDLTALAWRDYSSINTEYQNFTISRQCEIETNLICNQSNKPKLFHKFIRRKKKGKPPVGPLKKENCVIPDRQEMSEVFVHSFRSVFSPVLPLEVNPHQESETEMRQIHLSIDEVFSQLNK